MRIYATQCYKICLEKNKEVITIFSLITNDRLKIIKLKKKEIVGNLMTFK